MLSVETSPVTRPIEAAKVSRAHYAAAIAAINAQRVAQQEARDIGNDIVTNATETVGAADGMFNVEEEAEEKDKSDDEDSIIDSDNDSPIPM